ncbi:hypothetical protein [Vibrio sp. SCSIO 43137]|uniref:hypothetical protein n=1 Tax=Vibrio sp. SCSIO 43137 TaxID=3021011 RepID=UPI002307895E|nr:hypothetical protein [Vibrio sp. SCSIO 43137]WCE31682.1 hypothetical protein PK654_21390 [Vibrio sp. SCSIO 43137]
MELTSTQIGAIAENLAANELMIESDGRLSPFQPIADDDGIDVLVYDKVTGGALPIQIKARTNTIKKAGKEERGNTVHFEVRKATHREDRYALLLCILLSQDLRSTERAWLLPLSELSSITNTKAKKYVIRANKQLSTSDRYKKYQCTSIAEVGQRLIAEFERNTRNK